VFRPEPRIPFVPALREQVLALVGSINQPQISVPGRAAEPASGHLCVLRNGNGSVSVFVGFHLLLSGVNVVYVHEPPQLAAAAAGDARQEAIQLLESMGFMLDDLRFEALAPAAQEELLRKVPLFSPAGPAPAPVAAAAPKAAPPRPAPAVAAPAPAPAAAPAPASPAASGAASVALGRLLASF
jgi:hypothetical protein